MGESFPWIDELIRLNDAIRPIAEAPVDLEEIDSLSETDPLGETGVRIEAQAILMQILHTYETGTDLDRIAIRGLVELYEAFFWAAGPSSQGTPTERLRTNLLRFAVKDQFPDPRDAVMWLHGVCESTEVSVEELKELRREVAQLANSRNRYGFGSTRSMLLKGYSSELGSRGAPGHK